MLEYLLVFILDIITQTIIVPTIVPTIVHITADLLSFTTIFTHVHDNILHENMIVEVIVVTTVADSNTLDEDPQLKYTSPIYKELFMNLNQYVSNAVRTESQIEKVTMDGIEVFYAVLQIFIASGNILDMYKKNIFYGKEIDWDRVESSLDKIDYLSSVGKCEEIPQAGSLNIDPRVFHALIGTATEATELMEALFSTMEGDEIDYVNVMEEFGDINWYEAIGCDATGVSFEDILNTNIEKLRNRFPEKFTSENAIKRDLDVERNTLQAGLTKIS